MSKDPLKDLFNETFASEPIAFDPKAWDQMDSLLQRERRKKAFWIWLSGGSSLAIITIVCLSLIGASAKVYEPRHGASYAKKEEPTTESQLSEVIPTEPQSKEERQKDRADIKPQKEASVKNDRAPVSAPTANSPIIQHTSDNDSDKSPAFTERAATQREEEPMSDSNPVVTDNPKTIDEGDEENTPSITTAEVNTPPTSNTPKTDRLETGPSPTPVKSSVNPDQIAPMPALVLDTDLETHTPQMRNNLPEPDIKKPAEPYIRFGLSHAFRSGVGQIGGIGVSYQIANNVLLSGEVLLARDHTDFNYTELAVSYGFEARTNLQRIWTVEMLHAELPMMVSFRKNRFMIGTGLSAGLLMTSKVAEEFNDPSDPNANFSFSSSNTEEVGYVNWQSLRQLQFSIPIDAQYQLDERYFVGTRLRYGLTDAFVATPEIERLHRVELYLKMRLIR